jgi:hypothetical protein
MRTVLMLLALFISGCTVVAQYIGLSAGALQTAAILDRGKIIVDTASAVGTGKSVTDTVVGNTIDRDCNTMSLVKGEGYCKKIITE